jgi:CheY-like chemotaxis protein
MGGTLEVESPSTELASREPGGGSRFYFSVQLPVLAVDATESRSTASIITGYHGRRRRLLIVDDITTNRHVLRELLAPLGFEISEAASGAEALAALPNVRPDLVFLDLRMPGIDGLELARRLRAREAATLGANGAAAPKLKIIAMSASVLSFNREDAFAAGCDDFLPKPFREDDLLARLGLALHLEWIGDLSARAEPARSAGRFDSNAPFPMSTQLGLEALRSLLATAQRGEITALRQQLEAHRGDPLADALHGFAKSYRMEKIREILEQRVQARSAEVR